MKRDIKINYGKIEDIISNIIKYDGALNDMEASLNCIKGEINNSTGESIDSLLYNYELLIKNIGICKEELNDLRKILSDYINEMSGYAQAIHRGSLIRVDRNDVWWNIKSMEGIINQITDEQMRWGYNYSGSWSSDKDVIRREEYNASQIESINHIVEKYVNILNQKIQEIYAIHNSKVIPFENTDDAFRDRAWNMYWKCTGLGDWVGDFFGFLDKSFNNIIDGVLKGLTDLVVGLAQLAIGAVEYVGSCAVVVLCEPFGGAPDWIKNKMDSGNELILSILKDPALIVEGIAQDASDAIDEKGICYSVGYLAGTFLGTKGLDKITKGVKGLISGGKAATINSLDDIARYGLNSLDDIIEKAGIQSVDDLTRIGVTSAEDLSKLGVNSVDDLAKLGINNIDELSKLGVSAEDLSKAGIKGISKANLNTCNSIKKIINHKGYSVDEFVKLLHPDKVLSDSEKLIVDSVRKEIGLPSIDTLMCKTIPQSDIYKYLYSPDYDGVRGFTAVEEHGSNLKTLLEKYNGARLDYNNTAFKTTNGVDGISQSIGLPDKFYGTIEYKVNDIDKISIPNWKPKAGDYPYTGKAFTGSTDIVLPEYYQSVRKFINGDKLNILDSKTGNIIQQFIYDEKLGWLKLK
ncbi:hypothetical protein [Clostridium sporogenes]|uniref:hypothetical protein n=3 Tax=Clostridium sporogenes TaxID=1509 RepID=UPI003DA26009